MSLDFGSVQDYSERGFGFVSRTLGNEPHLAKKVFFHIKSIKSKYPELARELDEGNYGDASFWYDIKSTPKGLQVSDIWLKVQDIPEVQRGLFSNIIEQRWQKSQRVLPDEFHRITKELLGQEAYQRLHSDWEQRIRQHSEAEIAKQHLANERRKKENAQKQLLAEEHDHKVGLEALANWRWLAKDLWEEGKREVAEAYSHDQNVEALDVSLQIPPLSIVRSSIKRESSAPTQSNTETNWWISQLKGARNEVGSKSIEIKVVGVTFENRQVVVQKLQTGEQVWLRREPNNRHDRKAICVERLNGEQIGYVDRYRAAVWAPLFDAYDQPVKAVVSALVGGRFPDSQLGVRIRFTLPVDAPSYPQQLPDFDDNWDH